MIKTRTIVGLILAASIGVGVCILMPENSGIVPQKAVEEIKSEFNIDNHVFADARRRCRESIRKIEPEAKFGNTVDRRHKGAVIILLDWKAGTVSHNSFCRVVNSRVVKLTIDNAMAYYLE